MITLRPLAVSDLTLTFARQMEGNLIKHYKVSYVSNVLDKPAHEQVMEYVLKELAAEGKTEEEVEIENYKPYTADASLKQGSALSAREAPEVLADLPKVRKQLEKREIKSQVYEFNKRSPLWQYLLNPIKIPLNWFINKVNKVWISRQWAKMGGIPKDRFEYLNALMNIKFIPILQIAGDVRAVEVCHYLSICFEESDRDKAIDILKNDLKILAEHNLIMGHLCKPCEIDLADTIGSGQKQMALFCFLFINTERLLKMFGKTMNDFKNTSLILNELLGLKTESHEGSLGTWDMHPSNKYIIEEIYVNPNASQECWNAYIKNYEEQQEAIKKNDLSKRSKV
jgi:hypothetical protein